MTIQLQHDVHDFRQFRSLIQSALGLEPGPCSGWLVYPTPFWGLGLTATGYYGIAGFKLVANGHVHWALRR